MSGINDFLDMMPETVDIALFSTRDAYGVPTYSIDAESRARLVFKFDLIRTKDGREIPTSGVIWLAGAYFLSPDDRIVIEDTIYPTIVLSETYTDENGAFFTKCYFG